MYDSHLAARMLALQQRSPWAGSAVSIDSQNEATLATAMPHMKSLPSEQSRMQPQTLRVDAISTCKHVGEQDKGMHSIKTNGPSSKTPT